jgi:hypothetical protein
MVSHDLAKSHGQRCFAGIPWARRRPCAASPCDPRAGCAPQQPMPEDPAAGADRRRATASQCWARATHGIDIEQRTPYRHRRRRPPRKKNGSRCWRSTAATYRSRGSCSKVAPRSSSSTHPRTRRPVDPPSNRRPRRRPKRRVRLGAAWIHVLHRAAGGEEAADDAARGGAGHVDDLHAELGEGDEGPDVGGEADTAARHYEIDAFGGGTFGHGVSSRESATALVT